MTIATRTQNNPIPIFNAFSSPTLLGGSNTALMRGIAINPSGLYVAVGYLSSGYPAYSTSTDGITWTAPAAMNGSTTVSYMFSVAVNSAGLFVAVGYNASNYPVYAYSSDGSTWTTPTTMGGSTTGCPMFSVTVNSSGLYVAVGYFTGTNYPAYATSSNGTTWSVPAAMNGSTSYSRMSGITVNSSGKFVAVGYNGSFNGGVYAVSSNGSTWTTPTVFSVSASYGISLNMSITVSPTGLFVVVGDGDGSVLTGKQAFVTSFDGSTWTTPAQIGTLGGTARAVAANAAGVFVCVGGDGVGSATYAYSINGTTWTGTTPYVGPTSALTVAVSPSFNRFVSIWTNGSSSYGVYSV